MVHDQTISNGEARLAAELGATTWLAAGLILPVRLYTTSIRYLEPRGDTVDIENPTLHHRNETLSGLGDPWLYGRAATHLGGVMIDGRLGATVPLGRTVPDPFVLGDMGVPHEHSQFGTGTVGLLAGVGDLSHSSHGRTTGARPDPYRPGMRFAQGSPDGRWRGGRARRLGGAANAPSGGALSKVPTLAPPRRAPGFPRLP